MQHRYHSFGSLCVAALIAIGTSTLRAEEPGAEEPGAEEPGAEEPGAEEPGAEEPGGDQQRETYQLRYKFRVGDVVHYTVENHSQIELQQGAAVQEVDHRQSTNKNYRVISTDGEGNATLELTIDRVQMSAAVDGGEPVVFDSASDKSAPVQFVGVAETVGEPHVRIQVSPSGKLLDIEWLVKGRQGGLPTEEDAGNLDIFVLLPEERLPVDETWKQRFETEVALEGPLRKKVTLQRTYRLTAVEDDRADIALQTSILTPLHDPAQEAQLIQKAPHGTIEFDLDRGVLLSRETSLDRTVVGFNGAKSRIRNVTTRTERIAEPAPADPNAPPVSSARAASNSEQQK